jgi:hypothetical protein
MLLGQAQQAQERTNAGHAAFLQHGLGPLAHLVPEQIGAGEQLLGAVLNPGDLGGVQMEVLRAETAR